MQTAGSPNASIKFKHDTHRPVSRFSSVTSATPAKRITFFKSGDIQFSGVRMAIHKRSFKCFDALLDDLSQKVPLPFGVRTITTPRGTHSIQRLEQLEDGGCYLCSDRRYVKPVDLEAAGRRPAVWHNSHPHSTRKKPSRPEEPPSGHSGQHYHRHPKRIVLVKNNDPTVRRSIILSRRTARSLRVFMDEISELMQCHVRKLYTLDGRKIDSVQSLMQCPNVLVCVGREPFKPLLLENLRKHSEEKLPGMVSRSRSSICSEGHESKKNVNFGLETKKSIIHPRSDSSNRSTRFSLSSEKSYPNGLCMTPGQMGYVSTCPYTKEVILNDDIEKRVLVNKDGSLSVEMKVRFRLVNDETLQWSTEIKKSATTSNESSSVKDGDAQYLQGKAEYSDPEFNSACDAEEACVPKFHSKHLQGSHCQNCCNHRQEYDIWKNPMHKDSGVNGARNSCSSSGSSHKIMHKKASVDSIRTISRSSEEYTEHVVEKASCFQQTVEEGDTRVEYCAISRCCSHSEMSNTATKLKSKRSNEDTCETNIVNIRSHSGISELGAFEIPKLTEDRPFSAVSNSSKVLESLKEDQDDDYDDLPPSASRASEWFQSNSLEEEKQYTCVHCCGSQASQNVHLSPRPPSKISSCSAHSPKHKKYRSMYQTPDSARSSASKVSSRSPSCQCGAVTAGSAASDMQNGLEERPITVSEDSIVSNKSRARSDSSRAAVSDVHAAQTVNEDGTESELRCKSDVSANTGVSGKSGNSTACPFCGGCERSVKAASRLSDNPQETQAQEADHGIEVKSVGGRSSKSHKSDASAKSERSHKCTQGAVPVSKVPENSDHVQNKLGDADVLQGRSESALSALSNASATSKQSNKSNRTACGRASVAFSMTSEIDVVEDIEERIKSVMSVKSNASAKSMTGSVIPDEVSTTSAPDNRKAEELNQGGRAISSMSGKSNRSSKCRSSQKSCCSNAERPITPACYNSDISTKKAPDKESERGESPLSPASASPGQEPEIMQEPRMDSAMSIQSNSSSKHPSVMSTSGRSAKSQDDTVEKDVSPVPEKKFDQDPGTTVKERAASAMPNTSKKSMKSNASSRNLQLVQEDVTSSELSKRDVATQASDVEPGERTPSGMSAEKQSNKSESNIPDIAGTSNLTSLVTEKCQESIESERPTSALSKNSEVSVKSNACSERTSKSILKPVVQATMDTKDAQNSLSVNSPSPIKKNKRAPIPNTPNSANTTGSNNRATSGISMSSKASSKSTRSKKCNCSSKTPSVNERNVQRAASSKSAKSPTSSPYPQSDEPLSPVSTVSLGLGEEERSDDLNERSIRSTSQILEENKSPLEGASPEPAVAGHVGSSEVVQTKERHKTSTSKSSAISKNSKMSPMSQNLCKSGDRAVSPASLGKPESVLSVKSKADSVARTEMDDGNQMVPSALSATHLCSKSPSKAPRPSETTKNNNVIKNNNSVDQMDNVSTLSGRSSKCGQSKIASGKVTPTGNSQSKGKGTAKVKNNSSSNIQIKGSKAASDCNSKASSVKSLKTSKSDNGIEEKEEHPLSVIPQNCPDPTHGTANKNVTPVIHLNSSDSVLSNTLSAAALLKEKAGNARSSQSGTNPSNKDCDLGEVIDFGSKCEKRSTSKRRKCSTSSLAKNEDHGLELMLSNLPNASPTEVINDWLKNIPTEGPMYELEDECDKQQSEESSQICESANEEEESLQKKTEEVPKIGTEMKEPEEIELAAIEGPDKEDNTICDLTETRSETDAVPVSPTIGPSPPKLKERQDLPKRCHSSVQVMKVLLSPKLNRCNSLPEVSPVYGRKLSTSAKGLLDCLANLQLIDSDPKTGKDDKYNEIISILQSLWIYAPNESEQDQHKMKGNCSAEDEFNPRSSSGVDVSSGSLGSGKGSFNGAVVKSAKDRVAPVIEHEALEIPEDLVKEDKDEPSCATPESREPSHLPSDALTPDIAERVRYSPEVEKLEEEQQVHEVLQATEEVIQSTHETNRDELSNESSGNNSNDLKSQVDKETESPENLETSSSLKRSVLSRKVSQDPDPVWVLSLLKKLEKQFMSHYANAMAEFKVKWDLDDSDMLDRMISELKEEVQKRIQSSINRELQKIQCRAGRAPRPPKNSMSRESTVQTEQRRRRLKVMKNKSISPSLSRSEDMYTASGTDVSDQRSDDEYCPCETCMKKKMESRAVQRGEALSLAPVMKDFDLRKILQTKKVPSAKKPEEPKNIKVATNCSDNQDQSNLDVVHEESEVHNQTDECKESKEKGTADATQSKEYTEEGLADDGNKAEEETSEGQAIEDGEFEVEGEKAKEEKEQEEEMENKEDSVAVDDGQAENTEDREETKEDDPTKEDAAETPNSEYGDEEQTPKDEETRKEAGATEEEKQKTEEQLETAEKGEMKEDVDGEDTESTINHKTSGGESGGESGEIESNTNDMIEGEENVEVDTATKDEGETPSECDEDGNQDKCTLAEDDAKDEDQGKTCGQPNETEKEGRQVTSLRASDDNIEQAEVEDESQDDNEAKSTDNAENQTEEPEDSGEKEDKTKKDSSAEQFNSDDIDANGSGQASDEDSALIKQLTKTSVESQPGSMEYAMDQKVQMKLKDIHSLMESSESQEDSIVVITKQSPFTERRIMPSRHGNKEEVENEVIEWQVSPKRRNRSPARANKLRRPKDSDVKVDDLEY